MYIAIEDGCCTIV